MAVILALDSSTEACSCALLTPGGVFERYLVKPREHTRLMLPLIEELLGEAGCRLGDLDALAYGRGPGSFTGLRIAAGVVQGLAFGLDLPVVQVSTLDALALLAMEQGIAESQLLTCIDARIDEIYWSWHTLQAGTVTRLGTENLCKPESVALPDTFGEGLPVAAIGNGLCYLDRMPAALAARLVTTFPDALPRAVQMARLAAVELAAGRSARPEEVNPVYLRDKVTHG